MSERAQAAVTQLLLQWSDGDRPAFDRLVGVAYDELARIGHGLMRRERACMTLQTQGLVHEAYLRLRELDSMRWCDRRHFFSVAAGVMRRVLVERARAKNAVKRGGEVIRVSLDEAEHGQSAPERGVDVLALDAALCRLSEKDEHQGRVVELRYFGGLTVDQTAKTLGMSPATVKRKWNLARAWLYRELCTTTP
ncbi:MAG: sigma-70 family RNA polymerase sigma factor [Gammaproteobacteria bacterium]